MHIYHILTQFLKHNTHTQYKFSQSPTHPKSLFEEVVLVDVEVVFGAVVLDLEDLKSFLISKI